MNIRSDVLRMIRKTKLRALDATPKRLQTVLRERRTRVWVDGPRAFKRIRLLINCATQSIIIRMFIWKNDEVGRRMRDALLASADRGVRISITKEASGDIFELHQSFLDTKSSRDRQWKRFWDHPNIDVHHRAIRDHSKVFIIDDHIVLLTGMNIANEYEHRWHDYLVELRGADFVHDLIAKKSPVKSFDKAKLAINMGSRMDVRQRLTRLIRSAKRSIVVEHCYLGDDLITQELIARTKHGVRITVIMPEHTDIGHNGNMEMATRLLSESATNTVRILLYPGMFHAKLILIDKKTAILGSANLNSLSLDRTGEVCIELRGRTSAMRKIRRSVRKSIFRSHPMKIGSISRFSLVWVLSMIGL